MANAVLHMCKMRGHVVLLAFMYIRVRIFIQIVPRQNKIKFNIIRFPALLLLTHIGTRFHIWDWLKVCAALGCVPKFPHFIYVVVYRAMYISKWKLVSSCPPCSTLTISVMCFSHAGEFESQHASAKMVGTQKYFSPSNPFIQKTPI